LIIPWTLFIGLFSILYFVAPHANSAWKDKNAEIARLKEEKEELLAMPGAREETIQRLEEGNRELETRIVELQDEVQTAREVTADI
jgi:hypothetical protein